MRVSAGMTAMIMATLLVTSASAQQDAVGGAVATSNPITVFTQDAVAMRAGGSADELVQHAREQGRIRVIVGLRTTMQVEHTLSPAEAERQAAALLSMQNGIAQRVLGRTAGEDIEKFTFIPYMSMFVTAAQANALLADPQVVSVQEDVPQPPLDAESIPLIHADTVWAKGKDGTGYTIAILDTGVAKTHPILSGKVVSEACYSTNSGANITSTCPGAATSSIAAGSGVNCNVAITGCDHGTHVASIAAAKTSANNIGVARGAKLIAVKVFTRVNVAASCNNHPPCPLSYTTDQIKGLQRVYALRNTYKIASVNMSLGGGKYAASCDAVSPALTTAVTNLRTAGIATLIASGNNGYTGFISSPACISTAIAVGNSTKTDVVAPSSNHSSLVKLLAPGSSINGAVPGNTYAVKSGTSMAAPHVAGAFGVLKQTKPTAAVADILTALVCSGKTIDMGLSGGVVSPLSPAKPRIDLIGAYNYLLKPPSVARNWVFSSASEAYDWTPFTGKWLIGGGRYQQTPIQTGWIGTSVANCNRKLTVITSMTRVDPGTTFFSNSGIIFKSQLNYDTHTVSGYWLAYNKCRTNSSGTCTDNAADPVGQAVFWRMDNYNFPGVSGGATLLCSKHVNVSVSGLNTVKVVSNGSSHSYYLNNTLVCTVTDANYVAGPVMAAAYIAAAGGHAYQVDYMKTTSMDTAAPAAPAAMDPAAFMPKAIPAGMSPQGSVATR